MRLHTPIVVFSFLMACLSTPAWSATLLVANKSEASLSLLALPSGREVARLPTGQGPHEVAVSPDGTTAVVTNYGTRVIGGETLTRVDLVQAKVTGTLTLPAGARPHGIEWLDEHRVAVTAEGIAALLIVDVTRGEVLATLPTKQRVSHMLAVTPDGQRGFVSNMGSASATVFDLENQSKLVDLPAGKGAEGIAYAASTNELWVANREDDTVTIFEASTLERTGEIAVAGFPIRAEYDAARGRLYIPQATGDSLAVVDVHQRAVIKEVPFDVKLDAANTSLLAAQAGGSSIPVGVQLAGDGGLLFVAHTQARVVSVLDADTLESLGVFSTGVEPDGMAWSPLDVAVSEKEDGAAKAPAVR